MREFFIPFRSRSEAIRFYEALSGYGIACKIVNTPSSARVGCGLSVKLFARDMSLAKTVLARGRYQSAAGIYYFSQNGAAIKI